MIDSEGSGQPRENQPVGVDGLACKGNLRAWCKDAGYAVHCSVCISVHMCIYVSDGVPETILGVMCGASVYSRRQDNNIPVAPATSK